MNKLEFEGSVNSSLLMMVIDFCIYNKINIPVDCFRYIDMSTLEPISLNERIPFEVWVCILQNIYIQNPINGLGLEIANHIKFPHMGIMSYLVFTEKTLLSALDDFVFYYRLICDFNVIKLSLENDSIEISWEYRSDYPGLLVDETAIAIFCNIIKQAISPLNFSLKFIKLIYPKPVDKKCYENYFKCPVYFDSQVTSVCFSLVEIEKIILNQSDPILHRLLKKQADTLINQLDDFYDFENRLVQGILYSIDKRNVTIRFVANYLCISPEKLNKMLRDSNLNFNVIVNKAREMLAKRYLNNHDLSIGEISYLLGYSEQSVFQRAFKKWTGETPLQYRYSNNKKGSISVI